jgi:hypothetical protein
VKKCYVLADRVFINGSAQEAVEDLILSGFP